MNSLFADPERGGFFFTSNDHEELFVRAKDQYDSVQPSGNSTAARNFVRLWQKTGENSYREHAEATIKAAAAGMKSNPTAHAAMAHALSLFLDAKPQSGDEKEKEPAAQGGAKKSETVVKITPAADKPNADGLQTITLTLKIDDGWHLYANPVPDDFPGVPVTVTVDGKNKPKDLKVIYPEGKLVKDAFVGDYRIYEKEEKIKVTFKRDPADKEPLAFIVKVQACTKQNCLPTGQIKVSVP